MPAADAMARWRCDAVRPPCLLIFNPTPSQASVAMAWIRSASSWISSSRRIGRRQRERSDNVSRQLAQGASMTMSVPSGRCASMRSTLSGVMPPLASARYHSPGCRSARQALIRSASRAGPPSASAAPIFTEWPRKPASRCLATLARMASGVSLPIDEITGTGSAMRPPRRSQTARPADLPCASQQATSIAVFAAAWPVSTVSMAS